MQVTGIFDEDICDTSKPLHMKINAKFPLTRYGNMIRSAALDGFYFGIPN